MEAAPAHEAYVESASERYREAYASVARVVKRVFPRARPVFEWGMPAWTVDRPKGAPMPERGGTIDPTKVFVGLVDRKGGVTLHLWYPGDYYFFDARKDSLEEAGFKVMRGCLPYGRKTGEYPAGVVEALLREVKEADAAGAAKAAPTKKGKKAGAARPRKS